MDYLAAATATGALKWRGGCRVRGVIPPRPAAGFAFTNMVIKESQKGAIHYKKLYSFLFLSGSSRQRAGASSSSYYG